MKGIIFNVLEEAVGDRFGPEAWTDLVDAAGVSGAYTSLGSYPDEEILDLVKTAAGITGDSESAVLRWFGQAALPILARRYGALFERHGSARSFVLSVNDIIHPEVRKLYAGAACPHFRFRDADDGALLIGYESPRGLCHLAQGFIEGAALWYGETVEVTHLDCMHSGAPRCRLAAQWN